MVNILKNIYVESLGGSNGRLSDQVLPDMVKNPIYDDSNMSYGVETEKEKEANFKYNDKNGFYEAKNGNRYFFQSLEKEANKMYNKLIGKEDKDVRMMKNSISSMKDATLPINLDPSDAIIFETGQDYFIETFTSFNPSANPEKQFVDKKLALTDMVTVQAKKSSAWRRAIPVFTQSPVPSSVNSINDLNADNKGTARGTGMGRLVTAQMPNANVKPAVIHVQTKQYTFNEILMNRLESDYSLYGNSSALNFKALSFLTQQQLLDFIKTSRFYITIGAGIKTLKENDGNSWSVVKVLDDNEDSFEGLFNNSSLRVLNSSSPLFKSIFGNSFTGFANADYNDIVNIFKEIAVKIANNIDLGGANPYKKLRIAVDYRTYNELRGEVRATNTVAGMDVSNGTITKLRLAYHTLARTLQSMSGVTDIDENWIMIYPAKELSECNFDNEETNNMYRGFSIGSYLYDDAAAEGSKYKFKRKMVIYDADRFVYPDVMSPTMVLSQKELFSLRDGNILDRMMNKFERNAYAQVSSTDMECAICYQYTGVVTPGVKYNSGVVINFDDEVSPFELPAIDFNN